MIPIGELSEYAKSGSPAAVKGIISYYITSCSHSYCREAVLYHTYGYQKESLHI